VTTDLGFLYLDAVGPLMDDQWSGFDYPNNAQVVPLLGDGVTVRNAVLQQSALTLRQGTLSCLVETADADTLRTDYEARSTVTFTDYDGATTDVVILDFTRSLKFAGVWAVTVILLELADPVPAP
jgi:hypothetical protein